MNKILLSRILPIIILGVIMSSAPAARSAELQVLAGGGMANAAKELAARFEQDGTDGVGSSPQEFAAFLRAERDQWTRVVKGAGIRIE